MTHSHPRVCDPPSLLAVPLREARVRRLFWLLMAAWIINLFDLGFTLLAHEMQVLVELNPIAARIIPLGTVPTVIYKLTLLSAGTFLLWRHRHCRLAEHGAWAYAAVCVGLSFWWHQLYIDVEPIVNLSAMLNDPGPRQRLMTPP